MDSLPAGKRRDSHPASIGYSDMITTKSTVMDTEKL